MTPRLLTIAGESRSVVEWSKIPGAAPEHTIRRRLSRGWLDSEAVFLSLGESPSPITPRSHPRRPAPQAPNPLRPTVGRVRSYPLESLDLLRRLA